MLVRIGSDVSKNLSYTHIPQTHSEFDFERNLQISVHVEIVNGTVISFSRCGPSDTVVTLGCFMALTRVRQ